MAIVLVLLIGLHLFHDAALSTIGTPVPENTPDYIWMGVVFAQPGLLAIWAAFGPEPLVLRLARTGTLAVALALAITWGAWLNKAGQLDADDLTLVLFPICQFAMMLVPFMLIRRFRKWRITGPRLSDVGEPNRDFQFSMVRLLVWTSLTAIAFAAGAALFRDAAFGENEGFPWIQIGNSLVMGITLGGPSLLIVFNLGATLAIRHRTAFVCSAAFLVILVAGPIWFIPSFFGGMAFGDVSPLFTVLIAFHISSLVSLRVIRAMGFRLTRTSNMVFDPAESRESTVPEISRAQLRFALLTASLLVMFGLLTWPALSFHQRRLDRAVELEWSHLGAAARLQETGVYEIEFMRDQPVAELALEKLHGLGHLRSLRFTGSQIADEQLPQIGQLNHLETLHLDFTPISDAGLTYLTNLGDLRYLDLRGSKITNNGASKLQESLPECDIDR